MTLEKISWEDLQREYMYDPINFNLSFRNSEQDSYRLNARFVLNHPESYELKRAVAVLFKSDLGEQSQMIVMSLDDEMISKYEIDFPTKLFKLYFRDVLHKNALYVGVPTLRSSGAYTSVLEMYNAILESINTSELTPKTFAYGSEEHLEHEWAYDVRH